MNKLGSVHEPAREVPVRHEVDVLVVGGGSAGIAAAIAAARLGASVLLVEHNGFLGGTLTMTTLGSICGLYTVTETEIIPIVGGIGAELMARLQAAGGARGPERWLQTASLLYDPVILRMLADDIVAESGVELVLHSTAVEVFKAGDHLKGVVFESGDGRWACLAGVVVDCTGDGDIAALCAVEFEYDTARNQAATAMFQFAGVDTEIASRITRDQLREHLERAVEAGLPLPRTAGGMFSIRPGLMHVNITRVQGEPPGLDVLDARSLTHGEVEGRQQVMVYQEAFRRFVPGFAESFVVNLGGHLGIRESRRIRGEYRLTLEDVLNQGRFADAIACSAWPVEDHGAGRATKWVFLEPGTYYQLPYRMLLPVGVEGLIVAGRCASASHDAHASMRVAAVCMALGEAAGVAAAQATASGTIVRAIDVTALQQQLQRQGAFLGEGFQARSPVP